MNVLRRSRGLRLLAAFGIVVASLAATATAAMARVIPPAGGTPALAPSPAHPVYVVAGGMPGWEITLIAVAAALVAAFLGVLAEHARSSRRPVTAVAESKGRLAEAKGS